MERLISFDTKEALEHQLVERIAEILKQRVSKNGQAYMLLSGGSTPKNLYQLLGTLDLDWSNIHIGLVDERFVNQENASSNEKLIRENLMTGNASQAQFHSMVMDPMNYDSNLLLATPENELFRNSDVIILGMGDDGHTASLFPTDDRSELATTSSELLANTTSPNEPARRITFCGPILQQGKHIFLMITGENKLEILAECESKKYPIHHFIPFIEGIYYTENA